MRGVMKRRKRGDGHQLSKKYVADLNRAAKEEYNLVRELQDRIFNFHSRFTFV